MKKTFLVIAIVASALISALSAKSFLRQVGPQEKAFIHIADLSQFRDILMRNNFPANNYNAVNYESPVGVWISYIDLAQMLRDSDSEAFRESISSAYKNIVSIGGNTVYVHVRAFGDAYYPSLFYPFTDSFGEAAPFDALDIMVSEAHKLGLSFHAWINPLRCSREESLAKIDNMYRVKELYLDGEARKVEESPYMWLDPASGNVRECVALGAAEIVSRYDVDGIHIDDYFYPTTSPDFDSLSFEKSGENDIAVWRRANITQLVFLMNTEIKKVNPSCVFEISPQGNIENNLNSQYADVYSWCASRLICDAVIPQVYFGYKSSSPYLETVSRWSEMTGDSGVRLIIGLGVYKLLEETEYINNEGIIVSQIGDAAELPNVSGIALYNYSTLFSDNERCAAERKRIREKLCENK